MHKNAIFQPHDEVVFTELEEDNEAVLLHIDTKMYYTLNVTGVDIWHMINKSMNFDEIVNELGEKYNIEKEKSVNSVNKIINHLLDEKLIEKKTID